MPNAPEKGAEAPAGQPLKDRKGLIIMALLVFALHVLVTGGHLMSPDGELLYRTTESLALRGTTAVLPIEADASTGAVPRRIPPHTTFATRFDERSGRYYAQYLPLQPLLAAPLVWIAGMLEGTLAEPFAGVLRPTMTTLYIQSPEPADYARAAFRRGIVVIFFNPIVAALSAVVLARMGRLLTGNRRAGLLMAGAWAFGTVAWPHSRTYFTEPLAGLLAILAIEQIIRWVMRPSSEPAIKHAILAGVFLALANWTRVDSPFLTLGIVLTMAGLAVWRYFREESYAIAYRRLCWQDVIACGGIALAAWVALQAFNAARYGFDPTSGYADQAEGVKFATPIFVGLHGLLFSPGKGMFFFSPALVLGLWGWLRIPGHLRWLRTATFCGFLPFFLAMATWQNWDGGWCWGPRHIVQLHLPIMLGAVFLFAKPLSLLARCTAMLIFVAGVGVQIYGSSQNPLDFYHEYFQTFDDMEYHRVNLTPLQLGWIEREFALREIRADGTEGDKLSPRLIPAPMIDSIYLPQHTQWYSYAQMWRFGYRDWYLWNAVTENQAPDRWSVEP